MFCSVIILSDINRLLTLVHSHSGAMTPLVDYMFSQSFLGVLLYIGVMTLAPCIIHNSIDHFLVFL